jgi:copper(I)-binding protein/cytochrome c553
MRIAVGLVVLTALQAAACTEGTVEALAHEIEQGRVLYAANGCGTCHGLTGRGDGPIGKTLHPPPRDFRDAAAFKNGADPAAVASTIATGLTRDGGQMQSYFHLSTRERHLLARYVISLRETDRAEARDALRITSAWVREPIPGNPTTAAYAVLENAAPTDVQIVSVSADVAGEVELHSMMRTGDMMKMAPVKDVAVPARGRVALEPGGLHLMLFQLKKALHTGETVRLVFITAQGATAEAEAPVKKVPAGR